MILPAFLAPGAEVPHARAAVTKFRLVFATLHAATRAGALDPTGREALLRYVVSRP